MVTGQPQDRETESFAGLLLRHRGRTGLTQRDVAARVRSSERSVQDWETGVYHPGAQNLKSLIAVLHEAGGLTVGREMSEAKGLWAAVLREAPRMHTPFDELWLAELLAKRAARSDPNLATEPIATVPAEPSAGAGAVERRQDWGEAPDVLGFVGRTEELITVRDWVLQQRCRLLVARGGGGIGKTTLAARLAQDVAPTFERVYWRSLRDAPPTSEWLGGAIGFLSDQRAGAARGRSCAAHGASSTPPRAAQSAGARQLRNAARGVRSHLVGGSSEEFIYKAPIATPRRKRDRSGHGGRSPVT